MNPERAFQTASQLAVLSSRAKYAEAVLRAELMDMGEQELAEQLRILKGHLSLCYDVARLEEPKT